MKTIILCCISLLAVQLIAAPKFKYDPQIEESNIAKKKAEKFNKLKNIKYLFSDEAVDSMFPDLTKKQRKFLKERNAIFNMLIERNLGKMKAEE